MINRILHVGLSDDKDRLWGQIEDEDYRYSYIFWGDEKHIFFKRVKYNRKSYLNVKKKRRKYYRLVSDDLHIKIMKEYEMFLIYNKLRGETLSV